MSDSAAFVLQRLKTTGPLVILSSVLVAAFAALGATSKASPGENGQTPFLSNPEAFEVRERLPNRFSPGAGTSRQFYFTRAAYTGYYRFRDFRSWSVDFPKADRQFLIGLKRLTNLDAYEFENPVQLTDPSLGQYPFLYTVEVGYMALTEGEVEGLRRYLKAGGFLVVDDFWGTFEYENFQTQFQRILPGYPIVDIPLSHPIFSCFYDVKEIVQVPNVGQGMQGGPTWESDGYYPSVKGIFDESGRLMVVINWNTDLGDAWEWAENPYYPLKFSTYAYQMGVNFIIYAMSH
ncbi:MAG TPA: DUF4159 domain-containing protein [Vicinamibacteria bacterium]|nr:DUF4159 domain-containing protein [Vicinamibacteria bacterium]